MDETLKQAFIALGFAGGLSMSACPTLAASGLNDDDEHAAGDKADGEAEAGDANSRPSGSKPVAAGR